MSELDLDDLLSDPEPEQTGPPYWICSTCWTEVPRDLEDCLGCGRWRFQTVDTKAGVEGEIDIVPAPLRLAMKLAVPAIGLLMLASLAYAANYVINALTWGPGEATIVAHHWRQETVIFDADLNELDRLTEDGAGAPPPFPRLKAEPGQLTYCQANYSIVLQSDLGGEVIEDRIAPMKPLTDFPQPCEMMQLYKGELSKMSKGTKIPVQINGNGAIIPDLFALSGLNDL